MEWEIYAFYFKKEKGKKRKRKMLVTKEKKKEKNTAHKPILHQTGKEKKSYRKILEARGPSF